MESPVFKLEGVVKTKGETSDFEGPLTLILQLLSSDRIEIRDISISKILEQYLEYLAKMESLDLDVASEFVAMASHLMYIKTKMLLTEGQEVSELEQLILSLEELKRSDVYLQIKEISATLSNMYMRGGAMMAGPPEYLPVNSEYIYIHASRDLMDAVSRIIGREDAKMHSTNPRGTVYPRRIIYSIPEKISEILERLKEAGTTKVHTLFFESRSRTELIATLIAVLELCKVGSVLLTGEDDDVEITYTGSGRDPDFAELELLKEAE